MIQKTQLIYLPNVKKKGCAFTYFFPQQISLRYNIAHGLVFTFTRSWTNMLQEMWCNTCRLDLQWAWQCPLKESVVSMPSCIAKIKK